MKVYDSNDVSVILAGLPVESGRGEEGGTFVKVSMLTDAFVDVVSLDGEVTRSKTNDNRADVMLTLMSSSASNALLAALHTADKLASNGAGIGPLLVKDRNGNTIFAAPACWIVKSPDFEFAQKAVPVEWPIRVANLIPFVGGN